MKRVTLDFHFTEKKMSSMSHEELKNLSRLPDDDDEEEDDEVQKVHPAINAKNQISR